MPTSRAAPPAATRAAISTTRVARPGTAQIAASAPTPAPSAAAIARPPPEADAGSSQPATARHGTAPSAVRRITGAATGQPRRRTVRATSGSISPTTAASEPVSGFPAGVRNASTTVAVTSPASPAASVVTAWARVSHRDPGGDRQIDPPAFAHDGHAAPFVSHVLLRELSGSARAGTSRAGTSGVLPRLDVRPLRPGIVAPGDMHGVRDVPEYAIGSEKPVGGVVPFCLEVVVVAAGPAAPGCLQWGQQPDQGLQFGRQVRGPAVDERTGTLQVDGNGDGDAVGGLHGETPAQDVV